MPPACVLHGMHPGHLSIEIPHGIPCGIYMLLFKRNLHVDRQLFKELITNANKTKDLFNLKKEQLRNN